MDNEVTLWLIKKLAALTCLAEVWHFILLTEILVGAIGVSGDSSCADHNIAWSTRNKVVGFNLLPSGVDQAVTMESTTTKLAGGHILSVILPL